MTYLEIGTKFLDRVHYYSHRGIQDNPLKKMKEGSSTQDQSIQSDLQDSSFYSMSKLLNDYKSARHARGMGKAE